MSSIRLLYEQPCRKLEHAEIFKIQWCVLIRRQNNMNAAGYITNTINTFRITTDKLFFCSDGDSGTVASAAPLPFCDLSLLRRHLAPGSARKTNKIGRVITRHKTAPPPLSPPSPLGQRLRSDNAGAMLIAEPCPGEEGGGVCPPHGRELKRAHFN
ncbi:hypothetical protein GWI33_013980 [Rhynchophorus ferrugineus]|uniref:Uncharacterized protein n=1 Tax=Rhynchophorus ferrugineus TaxID=354439 RepID=A0A834I5Z8_RHYFE|nr:hypothetical protein GWI33_013980 [Rhynchophorus ferrugineus]